MWQVAPSPTLPGNPVHPPKPHLKITLRRDAAKISASKWKTLSARRHIRQTRNFTYPIMNCAISVAPHLSPKPKSDNAADRLRSKQAGAIPAPPDQADNSGHVTKTKRHSIISRHCTRGYRTRTAISPPAPSLHNGDDGGYI